jgi:hypothetical protein
MLSAQTKGVSLMTRLIIRNKLNVKTHLHKDGQWLGSVKVSEVEGNRVVMVFEMDRDVQITREDAVDKKYRPGDNLNITV